MNLEALPIRKVAKALNVSTHTVYRAIERGDLPSFRLGARRFVAKQVLKALIEPALPEANPAKRKKKMN